MTETKLETAIKNDRTLRKRTRAIYLLGVQSYLSFAGGQRSTEAVQAWLRYLRHVEGNKPQTTNLQLRGLRYAAEKLGLTFVTPVLCLPSKAPAQRKPLTVSEARRWIRACNGEKPIDVRDRAILVLGLRTGVRRSAIANLSLEDIDGRQLMLHLKGDHRWPVRLDDEAYGALSPWLTWLTAHGVTAGAVFRSLARPRLDGTVTIRDGMSEHGVYFVMKARAKVAKLHEVYPHIFQTTFKAWLQAKNLAPDTIRMLTGRLTDDDAVDTYEADRVVDVSREAADCLPSLVSE